VQPSTRRARVYQFQGPASARLAAREHATGTAIHTLADLRAWLRAWPAAAAEGATLVVTPDGVLRLAPRRTEDVACAAGEAVAAAGEVWLTVEAGPITVAEVTNQSTGYCPEPESWPAVAAALRRIGLGAPDGYSRAFVFRRCGACGQLNVVKDGWLVCAVCDAALPERWNLACGC